ncbi:EF-P 5-aminopentanol modification-associated protein YfmH [Fructobacillus americanaquae]|uniref:Insulinase family protein n=1 Tax=Fructobacillus americanaquae TaxID=2940302 RepID=A0ABY5C321_9LACO|nr:pitrilysin family protein [Fructobacillus americanaquae]USS92444.1 insulinase family protein [Fructobacillus americanaquae]
MIDYEERPIVFQTTEGLTVNLIKKSGYHQFLAALTARFGSLTTAMRFADDQQITIPAGTAHFLEHKIFDKKDGDALIRFTELGADANAFTGPNQTTYYFTATSHILENLAWLMNFVQEPYFTEEKVVRERGIIEEEIKLYQDDPAWQLYQGIIGLLYPKSALSQDIAGTKDSLQAITPDLLYQIHAGFYQPKNLVLTVVGDFDTNELMAFIKGQQGHINSQAETVSVPKEELAEQAAFALEKKQGLSLAKGAYGLRLPNRPADISGIDRVKEILLGELALDLVFGDQTVWFQDAYEKGIFGDDFDYEYSNFGPYQYLTFFADGENQDQVQEYLLKRLAEAPTILAESQTDFTRLKKALAGQTLTSQNRPDRLGLDEDLALYGVSLFDKMNLVERFCLDDVVQCGKRLFEGGRLTRLVLEK